MTKVPIAPLAEIVIVRGLNQLSAAIRDCLTSAFPGRVSPHVRVEVTNGWGDITFVTVSLPVELRSDQGRISELLHEALADVRHSLVITWD